MCMCLCLYVRLTVLINAKRCPFCVVCTFRTGLCRANQDKSIPKKERVSSSPLFPVVCLPSALFMCVSQTVAPLSPALPF